MVDLLLASDFWWLVWVIGIDGKGEMELAALVDS